MDSGAQALTLRFPLPLHPSAVFLFAHWLYFLQMVIFPVPLTLVEMAEPELQNKADYPTGGPRCHFNCFSLIMSENGPLVVYFGAICISLGTWGK